MNADRSASARTRHIRARALAGFHVGNPNTPEGGRSKTGMGSEALVARLSDQVAYTTVNLSLPNNVESGCDCTAAPAPAPAPCVPGTITNFLADNTDNYGFIFPSGGDGSVENPYYFDVSWDPLSGAISYTVSSTLQDGSTPSPSDLIVSTGPTTARITTYYKDEQINVYRTFSVSAQTGCGLTTTSLIVTPCFLAGALVTLADGSTVPIEEVRVGDMVLGAFGESNPILALHRPLLGSNTMTAINGEHHTSSHHPHISMDRKFYAVKPSVVEETTYRQFHEVIDADGVRRKEFLHGLNKGRVQLLTVGISLKTVEGSRSVASLDTYSMPPDTQLYNLVVGGSHTYHVDGYAVTGWPREDDFDYDTWTVKK